MNDVETPFTYGETHFIYAEAHSTYAETHFTYVETHFTYAETHLSYAETYFTDAQISLIVLMQSHKRPFVGLSGGRSWTFLSTFGDNRPRFLRNLSKLTFAYPPEGPCVDIPPLVEHPSIQALSPREEIDRENSEEG